MLFHTTSTPSHRLYSGDRNNRRSRFTGDCRCSSPTTVAPSHPHSYPSHFFGERE
ncbi:hypothetical protein HanRHA438_Chr05g0213291 [Helianthus annuus]|uniref:Uncharacterized protein n=1 Tax=Helianthus annuus TaxID=4232 RepID=A0A251UP00_HELAN|nr:hypothetical protein HanXRQr2_Chr05g0203441 [Helianthus annuus]KAJ0569519.1 hypothetical protein HanHA300_Chr05g0167091 [Helianthus annuus]KAJ0576039.1 hypothetical protein HanIR_Chr05g0219641 [Helianthus annuus]KAJ0583829.1 hypothetical protein HanHA89_Chr05g0181131 [Helianthus annuus]KAJ0746828.1 hypothetical protein HanOQP8_Chr05g0182411 [Helianthus annuus]